MQQLVKGDVVVCVRPEESRGHIKFGHVYRVVSAASGTVRVFEGGVDYLQDRFVRLEGQGGGDNATTN